jgi:hypothetical protein
MRDIRSDLQERLEATVRERMELGKRLRALESREHRLRALLQDEEIGGLRPSQLSALPDPSQGPRLREFVLRSLADGRAWSLDDMKRQARTLGLTTIGATGRALNITLVNLLREGLVTRLADGRWRFRNQGTQLALELASSGENWDPPDGEAQLAS